MSSSASLVKCNFLHGWFVCVCVCWMEKREGMMFFILFHFCKIFTFPILLPGFLGLYCYISKAFSTLCFSFYFILSGNNASGTCYLFSHSFSSPFPVAVSLNKCIQGQCLVFYYIMLGLSFLQYFFFLLHLSLLLSLLFFKDFLTLPSLLLWPIDSHRQIEIQWYLCWV